VPALLLIGFVVVPLAELYVILQVASVIGGWQTLALLIAESFVGTWLVKHEGARTWRAFQSAVDERRPPTREVADGALVVVGGALLLTPGFLSDIVGFFFLLPPTRPLARRLLLRIATRRLGRRTGMAGGGFRTSRRDQGRPVVIEGDVIEGDVMRGPDDEKPPEP
jgi:UPF0716 protein FxsA